jgi:tetratricopeptide (TPR) repeat protein
MLQGMKWLKKALGGANRERAEKLVTDGVVLAREGRHEDALRCYRAAVEEDEELAVAHLNEGLCLLDLYNKGHGPAGAGAEGAQLDEVERATKLSEIAQVLARALRLEEKSHIGWRALARVEERRGAFARAEDAWKNVREHAPADGPDRAEADKQLHTIAEDARIDRIRRRAIAAQQLDVDEVERKASLEELLLILKPGAVSKPVERGFALAGALARRGDDPRARELLAQAVQADGTDIDALRDLAGVCLAQADLVSALSYSMRAYVARPTDAALVCNVGVCHLGLGALDKAAEFIELSAQLEPKDPIVVRAVAALKAARAAAGPTPPA